MNREESWVLLCEWTESDSLRKHMLAVEAAMRGYAKKFGEDAEMWGIVGLIHDFDYEKHQGENGHP
ncbi:MAG: HAD family hydrolase, partial [Rubrobacteraceae bacterium]